MDLADLNFNLFSSFNEMQLIRIWFLFSGIFAMDSVTQKSVRFEEYLRNFKFHSNVESARQTALLNKWGSWGILFILENYNSVHYETGWLGLLVDIHIGNWLKFTEMDVLKDLVWNILKMLNFVFFHLLLSWFFAIRTCNTIHRQSSMVENNRKLMVCKKLVL